MDSFLDHVLIASPDLAQGQRYVHDLLGVEPVSGGSHPDRGTCNALLGLGGDTYIEVLAPDPAAACGSAMPEHLRSLATPQLSWWAVRCTDLEGARAALADTGIPASEILPCSRQTNTGETLHWRLVFPADPELRAAQPFLIDWGDTRHPCETLPNGGSVEQLELCHPQSDRLQALLSAVGFNGPVATRQTRRAQMTLTLHTAEDDAVTLHNPGPLAGAAA